MAGALPGVIGDVNIAGGEIFAANPAYEMGHRVGHGIDMAWGAGDRLGQHVPLRIIDPGRKIPGLAH